MTTERTVRFTEQFFDRLDWELPEERGASGMPSVTDFIVFELPRIRDRLASGALSATVETEVPGVRAFIASGVLVAAIVMYVAIDDDTVEVFDLDLDLP